MLTTVLPFAFYSFLITFILTPVTIIFARKFGFLDNPKIREHPAHTHQGIIPRAGGLPLFWGIFLPLFLVFPFNKQFAGIFAGAAILTLTGLWDDKKNRSPYIRLVINCLAALLVIGSGIGIPYITNPLGGILQLDSLRASFSFWGNHSIIVWADLFALLWIVWTTNIVGWSGGVDGQLPGFVAISAIVIGLLSLRFVPLDPNQLKVTVLSFATAGAYLGFLPWNFYPQKIMPGYGGKTLAGFMLALLSILSSSKLGTALLVLAVPMIDAGFIMVQRLLAGRSPVWASSGHLHHHLLSLGWGKRKIAFFYWGISALAGIAALTLDSTQKIFIWLLLVVTIAGFIILVNLWRKETETSK